MARGRAVSAALVLVSMVAATGCATKKMVRTRVGDPQPEIVKTGLPPPLLADVPISAIFDGLRPIVPRDSVYNVLLSPTLPGTTTHVRRDIRTKVDFSIGPPLPGSVLPADQMPVNPAISGATSPMNLSVTLTCTVCEEPRIAERFITYDPATSKSDSAVFEITPKATLAKDSNHEGRLVFHVTSNAKVYDRVSLPIYVDPPPTAPLDRAILTSNGIPVDAEFADVKLLLAVGTDRRITIAIDAPNEQIHGVLSKIAAPTGRRWEFRTNLTTTAIDRIASSGFFKVKKLMESWEPQFAAAQQITESDADRLLSDYSLSRLSPKERATIEQELGRAGNAIYRQLFLFNGTVERMINAIEDYANTIAQCGRQDTLCAARRDSHLTITVHTDAVYIPWPVLRSPSRGGLANFWGFKFNIAVVPMLAWMPPSGSLTLGADDPTPFAVYGDDANFKGVGWFGQKAADRARRMLGKASLTLLETPDGASDFLKSHRDSIKLFLSYLHATSGVELEEDERGRLVVKQIVAGPSLLFNVNDSWSSDDILQLMDELHLGSQRMLASSPIAILNACESGAVPYSPITNASSIDNIPMVLLQLGARAVIATDAPVWKLTAVHMGDYLVTLLLSGVPGPEALRRSRVELLKYGNPMGLLYSFYGDPNAQVHLKR